MSSSGMAATAPVPSPRCIPAVISGRLPRASSTRAPAGSAETWLASMALPARGHSRRAHRAATALMKPSISTGTPYSAPPRNTPHSPAMSKPPTFLRTSRTSAGSGRLTSRAFRMAATFRARPSSERPAPRPVISSAGRSSSTPATALEVVVLPMPISPVARSFTP